MVYLTNLLEWIAENEENFLPPVCNRMLYNKQLKVFLVGGPNERLDFHMQEGEEFFFMLKGDMVLRIHLNGRFHDITIREGEGFLLPARVAHSPQRFADTIGLVIERERSAFELDCLRWYTSSESSDASILFERWFHCYDLSQLNALIQQFTSSREFIVGQPGAGSFVRKALFEEATNVKLHPPVRLCGGWAMYFNGRAIADGHAEEHEDEEDEEEEEEEEEASIVGQNKEAHSNSVSNSSISVTSRYRCLFDDPQFSSTVILYGPGKHAILQESGCDLFLLQVSGSSSWSMLQEGPCLGGCLLTTHCITVPICEKSRSLSLTNGEGASTVAVTMPPLI